MEKCVQNFSEENLKERDSSTDCNINRKNNKIGLKGIRLYGYEHGGDLSGNCLTNFSRRNFFSEVNVLACFTIIFTKNADYFSYQL